MTASRLDDHWQDGPSPPNGAIRFTGEPSTLEATVDLLLRGVLSWRRTGQSPRPAVSAWWKAFRNPPFSVASPRGLSHRLVAGSGTVDAA
jgi:hypothetical protein